MIFWRYPYGKYDIEVLHQLYLDFLAQSGLGSKDVIAIPDNITIQKCDRETLIAMYKKIKKRVDEMFYEKKCQFNEKNTKPCVNQVLKCEDCEHYYSDDDARW